MGKNNITIITGHFGSGKTELSLHLATEVETTNKVYLCDMDVINPYFRSRDYEMLLEKKGIHLVAPKGDLKKADLPIITKEVWSAIDSDSSQVYIDLGGDKDGALSLGQFSSNIQTKDYEFIFVGNINRPYVSTVEGMILTIREIEAASRLKVTGIVNNTHLINDYIPPEDVLEGEAVCKEAARQLHLPFLYSFVSEEMWRQWDKEKRSALQNVVLFQRKLLTPWNV